MFLKIIKKIMYSIIVCLCLISSLLNLFLCNPDPMAFSIAIGNAVVVAISIALLILVWIIDVALEEKNNNNKENKK